MRASEAHLDRHLSVCGEAALKETIMNAMAIGRGMVCWLGLAFTSTALYGQDASADEPKPKESANLNAATEEYVRKLKAELDARAVEFRQLQADLQQAEVTREQLSAELQKLRQTLEVVAKEKEVATDNAKRQADKMMASMRNLMARQQRANDAQNVSPADPLGGESEVDDHRDESFQGHFNAARRQIEEAARATAAEAMKHAAESMGHAARQADAAASKLDEARRGRNRAGAQDTDEGWKKLLDRADVMLAETRRNEEAAAVFLPKLQSAVTQLRKAGRNDEANQLQAEADRLLGQARLAMPREEGRPETAASDVTPRDQHPREQSRARGDVERAVDELRREVEQLRREVRDLRQSLQRAPGGNDSSRQGGRRRYPTDGRRAASELVSVAAHLRGEVVRLGEEGRPIRVGDHVKKGETLAALFNEALVDMATGGIVRHLVPRIAGEWSLVAPASGTIVETNVSLGEIVSSGDVLFQIKTDQSEGNETNSGGDR
jgi:biotin carboxyl carrier protein